ncbi:MAG: 23S rRNA (adenine(2503)-C(2))-methyltransferase RlmN [Treponema sp.]|jgi:23S rRNA (adenine2503-C2)-methyltransferase|nr:23S rRNA (adenine(2503)-C(2))-methyltransferase RlmN [Treponema sp.]
MYEAQQIPEDTRTPVRSLSGFSVDELISLLSPLPPYKCRELFKWISRGACCFDDMTSLGKQEREELSRGFVLRSTGRGKELADPDGTLKLQIRLHDGALTEAVLLTDRGGRSTACISSQAGCPVGCVFCKTGSLGFRRNLEAGEMVEQFLHIREAGARLGREVTHLVIMGMGEPLLNLGELRRAVGIITDSRGLGLSKRRITASTSGIVGGIRELADCGPPLRLAFSLTSAREALRNALVPSGGANPLPRIKEALGYYQKKTGQRITLEAVLLGGLNTGAEEAAAFCAFARGLDVVVNLIPWNPVGGLSFRGRALREPAPAETEAFARLLEQGGLKTTRRFRRGRGISGACGQLGSLDPC